MIENERDTLPSDPGILEKARMCVLAPEAEELLELLVAGPSLVDP